MLELQGTQCCSSLKQGTECGHPEIWGSDECSYIISFNWPMSHLIFTDRIYKSHQSSVTNQRFSHFGQPHARVEVEQILAIEGQLQEKVSVTM